MNKTQIQILYFPDCPIYKELEKLVKEVIQELGLDANLELINIQTKEDAEKYHFTGSPGLRINGEDIDPLTKDAPVVLKSCKIYRTEEGMKMIPTKKMIQEALETAQPLDLEKAGVKINDMIYIGADHAGYKLKEKIKKYLSGLGWEFQDLGAKTLNPKDDYPDFAKKVAEKVVENPENKGIVICGTGLGSCIVANKIKGVRATPAWSPGTAKQAREHLDANVLCLGARVLTVTEAKEILEWWLATEFSEGKRHLRRIEKIKKIEK